MFSSLFKKSYHNRFNTLKLVLKLKLHLQRSHDGPCLLLRLGMRVQDRSQLSAQVELYLQVLPTVVLLHLEGL